MMKRRTFHRLLTSAAAAFSRPLLFGQPDDGYQPTWDSLQRHTVPDWFQNAKLGIFIHWGLYSVPAWAPPSGELGKIEWKTWFKNNPYAEWYLNSLRITGSPTYEHHVATYGKNFDYYRFAEMFNRSNQQWQPEKWAALFRRVGARYVVLTTKHHDGFQLWPSGVTNPRANGRELVAKRDLVGELTSAVRGEGLKMGLYYSGGLDWTFTQDPIESREDLMARVPQTQEYADYADAHWRELIQRYKPAVLWNDISYPKLGKIPQLFAQYYNTVPDGVIDNRFGVDFADYTTPEYAKYDKITPKKWESCRGLGFSFGYNQVEGPEQVIAAGPLIALLVDIVSKNGNLLLNIGPKPDGSISDIQMDRLNKLGTWLAANGEALFDTKPWVRATASSPDGTDIRFTSKGDSLYVIYLKAGKSDVLRVPGVQAQESTRVDMLGGPRQVVWRNDGKDVVLRPASRVQSDYAFAMKMTPAPHAVA